MNISGKDNKKSQGCTEDKKDVSKGILQQIRENEPSKPTYGSLTGEQMAEILMDMARAAHKKDFQKPMLVTYQD